MQPSTLLTFPRAERLLSTHPAVSDLRTGAAAGFDRVLIAVGHGPRLADALGCTERIIDPHGRARVAHFRTWRQTPSPRDTILSADGIFTESRSAAGDVTSAVTEELMRRGIRADGVTLESPPRGLGALIASVARDWQADVIVLGGVDAATFTALDLHDRLVRQARCPILEPGLHPWPGLGQRASR